MDVLGEIVHDWLFCSPDGAALPATLLHKVLDRAMLRIKSSHTSPESQLDAYRLLCVSENGLPSMLQLLCVGSCRGTYDEPYSIIHFLHFWQAFHELWRRLGYVESHVDDPFSEELSEFRDGLLRHLRHEGGITGDHLAQAIAIAQSSSADQAAWSSLSDVAASKAPGCQLRLPEVSSTIFRWLNELTRDYCRGSRNTMIWSVRDVVGCGRREACVRLGNTFWDVEEALRHFYASRGPSRSSCASGTSWSSRGAALRAGEVDCPICMEPYSQASPSVELQCCFQVMCRPCGEKLMNARGQLLCPFCRAATQVSKHDWPLRAPPAPGGIAAKRRDSSLVGLRRRAEQLIDDAGRWLAPSLQAVRSSQDRTGRRRSTSVGAVISAGRFR